MDEQHPSTDHHRRVDLFGATIDALTMDETVDAVGELIARGTPSQHVVLNASKVVQMQDDPALAEIIRSCDLVNADGTAVVWASRLLGDGLPERVAGIDLMDHLLAAAARRGWRVFFLGARHEVVASAVEVSRARHPGLVVAGFRDGYWDDDDEVISLVREAEPDILLLAIPSPRKEFWLNSHLDDLGVPFVMGVGGSFDVVAGKVSRAPRVLQRLGLEWTWRLAQEPRRMWRRYMVGNSRFIALVGRQMWRERRNR